ncbi:MAG: TIM-barrel domain-containing protein, partial [Bacteroidota bacterium]
LAFVFRNQNGAIIAKELGESDIYYPPLEFLEHGPLQNAHGKEGQNLSELRAIKQLEDGSLLLESDQQALLIRSFGERSIQFNFFPQGHPSTRPSEAVVQEASAAFSNIPTSGPLLFPLGDGYQLQIDRSPISLSLRKGQTIVWRQEMGFFADSSEPTIGPLSGFRSYLQTDEQLYGAGLRALPLNRRGQRLYNYNTSSQAYTLGEEDLGLTVPFVLSSQGYGLFFDTYRRSYLDLGQTEPSVLEFGVKDTMLSFFLIFDERPANILQAYHQLTGLQQLPPRWALGYLQTLEHTRTQAQTEEFVQQHLSAGYPLDAILMGQQWFGGETKLGSLIWDPNTFPTAGEMIERFAKQGVNTLLLNQAYIRPKSPLYEHWMQRQLYVTNREGEVYNSLDFRSGPAALLDASAPQFGTQVWPFYQERIDQGIAGWWTDDVEPAFHPLDMVHAFGKAEEIHNLYGSLWAKTLFEQQQYHNADQRFFNLHNAGYAGIQRYSAFPSTGKAVANWDGMRAQPLIVLGGSMNGLAYLHSGVVASDDPELNQRWLQMATFMPIMRSLSSVSNASKRPVLQDSRTQSIARKYLTLRYRFLPHNYSLAYENHLSGAPLVRPYWYQYPDDTLCQNVDDAYLWGESILICPIFEAGVNEVERYLPGGKWYDYWTDEVRDGGLYHLLPTKQDQLPILVKAGAFISLYPKFVANTQTIDPNGIEIHYYVSESASEGKLFWDDGISTETIRNQDYQLFQFLASKKGKKLSLNVQQTQGNRQEIETLRIVVHGLGQIPKKVKRNGKKVPLAAAALWDEETGQLSIELDVREKVVELEIK